MDFLNSETFITTTTKALDSFQKYYQKELIYYIEPAKTLIFLVFLVNIIKSFYKVIKHKGLYGALKHLIAWFLQAFTTFARKSIPGTEILVQKEIEKTVASIHRDMCPNVPGEKKYIALPVKGLGQEQVMKKLTEYQQMGVHYDWKSGKISGTVYHGGEALNDLLTDAFRKFIVSNPLHPETFPGLRKMEAEIVSMVVNMYNGDKDACGSITSGGSESIIMALKTHREWAREKKGITDPEIVIPVSAHAAFDKGAQYFGITIVHVPVDDDGRVNIKKVANSINRNTIMLAGSTPNFPHGSIDDIPALGKLALKHNIGLHVDSCLGGFVTPFMEDAGFELPHFCDFRVPGVTSISCDTHKYGFAPKGSSVIMYKSRELRKYQYFLQPNWTGGVYGSPTIAGSRPGALSAGCWAAMLHFGHSGYVNATKQMVSAARKIKKCIQSIDELELIGDPYLTVVAFKSKGKINIFSVSDVLSKKGYQLNVLQYPSAIHIACTMLTVPIVNDLVKDIKETINELNLNPSIASGSAAKIYGSAAAVPDRSIIGEVICGFLDGLTKI